MAQQPQSPDIQIQSLLSDFNTRLIDLEERNRLIKERVLLLGQNLISSRDELDKEMENLKKDSSLMKKEIDKLKILAENLLNETDKFVKRDEVLVVERMLKDFQPLEFARIKDVEELINRRFGKPKEETKNIKTKKLT